MELEKESDEAALNRITKKMNAILDSNDKDVPVIGILTKATAEENCYYPPHKEILEPKYLFLLQDAIVVPISLYTPPEKMREELLKVNGLCLPGGASNVWVLNDGYKQESDYTKAGQQLLKLAIELNDEGIYFPVMGICLGFQMMTAVIGDSLDIVEFAYGSCDYNTVLNWTSEAPNSKVWDCFSKEQRELLSTKDLSFNYHFYKVDVEKFKQNQKLDAFFKILSTSPSKAREYEFISIIEGKHYPFYAFQHHPEWCYHDFYYPKMQVILSKVTEEIGNSIAKLFLDDARKNRNVYPNKKELKERIVVNAPTAINETKGYVHLLNGS